MLPQDRLRGTHSGTAGRDATLIMAFEMCDTGTNGVPASANKEKVSRSAVPDIVSDVDTL